MIIAHNLTSRFIVANEGVKGLFKGLGPNLVGVAPSRAIYFWAYFTTKSNVNARLAKASRDSPQVHFVSAGMAGEEISSIRKKGPFNGLNGQLTGRVVLSSIFLLNWRHCLLRKSYGKSKTAKRADIRAVENHENILQRQTRRRNPDSRSNGKRFLLFTFLEILCIGEQLA